MKVIRFFSIGMVLLLLLPCLAACSGGSATPGGDTKPAGTQDSGTQTGQPEDTGDGGNDAPIAIRTDFEGYEFSVLTRGSGMWTSNDICGEMTGNVIDQAVYRRNQKLCNQYNFVIKEKKDPNWLDTARTLCDSDSNTYNMFSFRMNDMPELGQKGYLMNLNEVNGLNLDAPYYNQTTRRDGSFFNYLFFLTGDLIYMDDMALECVLFNSAMARDLDLFEEKSIYQTVLDGEWTFEAFENACKTATYDKNGDGTMTREDNWGFCMQNANLLMMNAAMGNHLLEKNDEDVFVLNRSEKVVNDLESIMRLLNAGYSSGTNWDQSLFTNGNQLFDLNEVSSLPRMSATDIEFGVVPYPKKDTQQKEYYSFITTYGSNCITICSSVKDLELTANIIELLSYESMQTVTPTLSEYLLGGRVINHAEDAQMLLEVQKNPVYELCYLWSTGSLYSTLIALNAAHGGGIASALETSEGAVAASVERKLERLKLLG